MTSFDTNETADHSDTSETAEPTDEQTDGTTREGAGVGRRPLLAALGAGSALTLGGGVVAETQEASLDEQLATVRSATEQYADPQVALEDGFVPMGPFVPGMGWHFINQSSVQAAVQNGLSVDQPQLLTYGDTGAGCDGELVLASVEYAIPVGARGYTEDSPPDLLNDQDGTEEWHVHPKAEHVLALPPSQRSDGLPESLADVPLARQLRTTNWFEVVPGGSPGSPMFQNGMTIVTDVEDGRDLDARTVVGASVHPDLWTLHAWVHQDNPAGPLAETNATIPSTPED